MDFFTTKSLTFCVNLRDKYQKYHLLNLNIKKITH